MYYAFPSNTSFKNFVNKIKQLPEQYVFVMLTFSGCYPSMITKQRYLHERLHQDIPLLVVDVRQSPQIYHHLSQVFPGLFFNNKIPLHVCFKKQINQKTDHLELKPVLRNATILGDRHFSQLRALLV